MRRLRLAIPFFLTATTASMSPIAEPVRLDWGSLRIVMMADSIRGTVIWGSSRVATSRQRDFLAVVEPTVAHGWTRELREFLALRLTSADTGSFRASTVLESRTGDWVYVMRLKRKDRWLDERFIVLQGASRSDDRQLLIEGTERNAIEFLEALESVNTQALNMPPSQRVDSVPIADPADSANGPVIQPNPPRVTYPTRYRADGKEGEVWLSFIVTAAGSVDSSSIEVYLSDGEGFESSVRTALVSARFTPAKRNGAPISMRAFQAFTFRIIRCSSGTIGFGDPLFVARTC